MSLYCKNRENKLLEDINDMSTLKILASGMNFKKKQRYELLREIDNDWICDNGAYSPEAELKFYQKAKKKYKKKTYVSKFE
jgi:hypothetical protein